MRHSGWWYEVSLRADCATEFVLAALSQIVDSVTALFRADYTGRGELSERQQKLNQHMNHLKKIAEDLNIAVVLINQGMTSLTVQSPSLTPHSVFMSFVWQ